MRGKRADQQSWQLCVEMQSELGLCLVSALQAFADGHCVLAELHTLLSEPYRDLGFYRLERSGKLAMLVGQNNYAASFERTA